MKMVYLKKVKGHKGVYYHTGFKRYYKTEGLDFIAIKKPKKERGLYGKPLSASEQIEILRSHRRGFKAKPYKKKKKKGK